MSNPWYTRLPLPEEVKTEAAILAVGPQMRRLETPEGEKELRIVSPDRFARCVSINRPWLYRGDFLSPVASNDYSSADCYLLEDGLAGFAVDKQGWLLSFFSNEPWKGFASLAAPLVSSIARKLVAIVTGKPEDARLPRLYRELFGFRVVANTVDDRQAMKQAYGEDFVEEFVKMRGVPFHVFMARVDELPYNRQFEDYYDAFEYVDGLL